jgi:hypothetical protein
MNKSLENAIGKVLRLPVAQQELAAELLEQVAARTAPPYVLSDDERAVVDAALTRVQSSTFAAETEVDAVLRRPWRKD